MNDIKNHVIIRCPKCGYEYLASEVFYPDDILGSAKSVLRDDFGHILLLEDGEEPKLETSWVCDNCGHEFKAKLEIRGASEHDQIYDFSEDYIISTEEDKEKLF